MGEKTHIGLAAPRLFSEEPNTGCPVLSMSFKRAHYLFDVPLRPAWAMSYFYLNVKKNDAPPLSISTITWYRQSDGF
jgi:hypothetical protein